MQHVGERSHPFNTARIVQKALQRCDLVVDHNQQLGQRPLPIQADAGLLYPHPNSLPIDNLRADQRPKQLVIVDGTWHQAKTIVRDVPQLQRLPCYRLTPPQPGRYRIRLEPNAQSLSTLEATVAALRALEPTTVGLEKLLSAFDHMVDSQLVYTSRQAVRRLSEKKQPKHPHIPRVLLAPPENLVVAYGEATPSSPERHHSNPLPVNWVAHRLGTSDRFACRLLQQLPLSDAAMQYMRLTPADFHNALSADAFRQQWGRFLRRNDVLIVYHQRTAHLLRNIDASQPRCLVLKSIFGKISGGYGSLEELLAAEQLPIPPDENRSRACKRLEMAVALVDHLRRRFPA